MIRKLASRFIALAPLFTRAQRSFTVYKSSLAPVYRPAFCSGFGLIKGRSFAVQEKADNIKELGKAEEWENYATKVSEETPLIVEFFAK